MEIGRSDRPGSAGPPRQQAVLAVLIAHDGVLVPIDVLIEQAWDGRPPARARTAVHVYVSRLRRLIAEWVGERAAHDILVTKDKGYLLCVGTDQLDATRFRSLVAQGQQALQVDRADRARRLVGDALALWRGPVLGGLALESVRHTMVAPLDELRLAAFQTKIDAELRLGRHDVVVPELRALVAAHPYRERFRGQLMLALYRTGRQAEALTLFEQTRRQLRDELGADPGVELRRLHQEVLRGDPALATPAGQPDAVPAQLPPDVAGFTGRRAEFARLAELLCRDGQSAPAIGAINGTGGVGKSALAVHIAHQLKDHFPDGQLYVNLHGNTFGLTPLAPLDVLGRWLRALGVDPQGVPADTDEASAHLRSLIDGRRMLVLCDDAADAAQVRPLLPAAPTCAVLVTSRRVLATLENATHVHLDVLSEREATALLGRLVGPDSAESTDAADSADEADAAGSADAAAEVVRWCGRLPLAIRIAAARLATHPHTPLRTLAERLSDEHHRLDELEVEDLAVRASLAVSYHDLGADPAGVRSARMFRLLGLLDTPDVGVTVAAALSEQPVAEAEAELKRLLDAQLVHEEAPGRHRMHDLIRLLARERAEREEPAADREAAVRRALGCYLEGAERATLLLDPNATRRVTGSVGHQPGFVLATAADATDWLDAEHANLVAATHQAASGFGRVLAVQLAAALYRPLHIRGRWQDLISLRVLAAHTAVAIGDRPGEALACEDLGFTYVQIARPQDAIVCAEHALEIWRDVGDRVGQQACLNILGIVYRRQERYDDAIACLELGLEICREIGDRRGQAGILNSLGLVHQRLLDFDPAVACHQRSVDLHRELANRDGEAVALANLGWAHYRAGHAERAITCQESSLLITRALGHRYQQAESLWGLGQAQHMLGQRDQARASWRHSVDILQDIGELNPTQASAILDHPVPTTPDIIRHNT